MGVVTMVETPRIEANITLRTVLSFESTGAIANPPSMASGTISIALVINEYVRKPE